MVGHQHVGVDQAAALVGILLQPVEIDAVVFIAHEAALAVVAPLDEVQRDTGKNDARTAGHLHRLRGTLPLKSTRKLWSVPYIPTYIPIYLYTRHYWKLKHTPKIC
jgi:hypothetical protein